MVGNGFLCHNENNAALHDVASVHYQLRNLLFHWFGWWIIWIAIRTMVRQWFSSEIGVLLTEKYFKNINRRFPFNWKTPFGYLIAYALEYMGAVHSISIVLCQTTFIIASYWMLISLGKDITNELNTINAAQEDRLELTMKLSNVIHLHSNAKQLSDFTIFFKRHLSWELQLDFNFFRLVRDFLNAYEFNILIHFFWTILSICGTLLLIQMELVGWVIFCCC